MRVRLHDGALWEYRFGAGIESRRAPRVLLPPLSLPCVIVTADGPAAAVAIDAPIRRADERGTLHPGRLSVEEARSAAVIVLHEVDRSWWSATLHLPPEGGREVEVDPVDPGPADLSIGIGPPARTGRALVAGLGDAGMVLGFAIAIPVAMAIAATLIGGAVCLCCPGLVHLGVHLAH